MLTDKWNPPLVQNHTRVKPPSKYKTLEHLLDDYKQSGVDSEGHFTLNPARARELLKQFQLPEAAHYALHIVSFLVGAGARGISISSSRSNLRFEAPGARMEEETIRSPFSVLLRSNAQPHLSELALGLNTLLGQPGGKVEICFDKWTANYKPDNIAVSENSPTGLLTITARPRLGGRGQDRELELIGDAFRWCSIPVKINGKSIPTPQLSGPPDGLEIHLKNDNYPLQMGQFASNRIVKELRANFSALIRVGRHRPTFRVVHLGRHYERPLPFAFFLPGWQVDITVNSDQFKKDLSQQDILENEKYRNLLLALRVQLEEATELLLSQNPPLTGSEDLVDDLVELLFRQGQVQEAFAFQCQQVQSLGLGGESFQKGRAIYRLGLLENLMKPNQASPNVRLGFDMLCNAQAPNQFEPNWTVLKARMAFNSHDPKLASEVNALIAHYRTLPVMKEHCYRWFLRQGHADPRLACGYRVELARQAFESGRPAEALTQLEAAQSGREGECLKENPPVLLKALQLHGELAAQNGQIEKSLEMFGKQLAMLREKYGQYSLELGLTLERIARLLDHAGQTKQAKEYRAWSQRLYEK
jgi:hypothetical protein